MVPKIEFAKKKTVVGIIGWSHAPYFKHILWSFEVPGTLVDWGSFMGAVQSLQSAERGAGWAVMKSASIFSVIIQPLNRAQGFVS